MKQKLNTGVLLLSLGVGTAFADLVSLGPDTLSGQGLGHVDTVLTMQSPGSSTTESGCVGAGVGGTTVTGSSKCPGNGPNGGNAFTGGDEIAINNAFSASSLGLTDFNNLRILFNADQPAGGPISLGNLALTLWNPTNGQILDARYVVNPPVNFASTNPGIGNAGFFFGLTPAEAAVENGILAAFPNLFIGLDANASMATGGPETFSVGVSSAVPEPAAFVPIALVMAVFALRKRLQFR